MVSWLRNDFFKILTELTEVCPHPVTRVSHIATRSIAWHPIGRVAYFLLHVKGHQFLCQSSIFRGFIPRHCRAIIFSLSCQKWQKSVHTFPQDFSFFSSLPELVELWLKKKGENNWTSQRLGYQNARKIMGSLNIGLFFLIGGWKIAWIEEKCPKRLFLTFLTTKTHFLIYRASWKLTYMCIGIPSACACKIMEIGKFIGTQKWPNLAKIG